MRIIELTMPLYEGMALGNVFPGQRPFEVELMFTYPTHQQFAYHLWCEQGTRLVMPGLAPARKEEAKLDEVDLSKVVFRDTVILHIPKGPNEPVMVQEVERAFARADLREGDAILVHSGWGDDDRHMKLGDDYVIQCPYYLDDTCQKLVELMTRNKSDLFCYDTANMHDYLDVKSTWCQMKPRPKPYPSAEAKEFIQKQIEKAKGMTVPKEGIGVLRLPSAGITLLGGLINCDSITKERVKLIALPLRVKGGVMAPCHVIAIEE